MNKNKKLKRAYIQLEKLMLANYNYLFFAALSLYKLNLRFFRFQFKTDGLQVY